MDVTIVNAVVCDRVSDAQPYDLYRVEYRWSKPPKTLAIWVEISNPAERSFTIGLALYRGRSFVGDTSEELILEGRSTWEGHWEFATASGLQAKAYSFVVLLEGVPARTIPVDFGHPEGK